MLPHGFWSQTLRSHYVSRRGSCEMYEPQWWPVSEDAWCFPGQRNCGMQASRFWSQNPESQRVQGAAALKCPQPKGDHGVGQTDLLQGTARAEGSELDASHWPWELHLL